MESDLPSLDAAIDLSGGPFEISSVSAQPLAAGQPQVVGYRAERALAHRPHRDQRPKLRNGHSLAMSKSRSPRG